MFADGFVYATTTDLSSIYDDPTIDPVDVCLPTSLHAEHALDTIVTALGRPESVTAVGVAKDSGGSGAEVLLGYPSAIVRYSASALLPKPYGVRGGYRAVCTEGPSRAAGPPAGTAALPGH